MSLKLNPEISSPTRLPPDGFGRLECVDSFFNALSRANPLSDRVTQFVLIALGLIVIASEAYTNFKRGPNDSNFYIDLSALSALPEGSTNDSNFYIDLSALPDGFFETSSQEPTSLLGKIIRWIF